MHTALNRSDVSPSCRRAIACWDEAAKGVRFGVLCEMVATFAGEDDAELRATSYLKGWVDTGMLAGFQLQ